MPPSPAAIGYGRFSREDKRRLHLSADVQDTGIRDFARAHCLELGDVHIDRAVSGGKLLRSRPEGQKVVDAIAGGTEALIVWRLDRLFRRLDDAAVMIRRWQEDGVRLMSVTENVDIATPAGWAMVMMMVVFAEMELRASSERSRATKKHLASQGKKRSANAPYGWMHTEDGREVPNAAEQKVRSWILGMHTRGHGPQAIATKLNSDGVPTRKGKPWHKEVVRQILQRAGRQGHVKEAADGSEQIPASE